MNAAFRLIPTRGRANSRTATVPALAAAETIRTLNAVLFTN